MEYIGNCSIKECINPFLPFSLMPFLMDYEGAIHISYYRLLWKLIRISSLIAILPRSSFEKWLSLVEERIPERESISMRMFLYYHLACYLQHRLHFYPHSVLFLLTENVWDQWNEGYMPFTTEQVLATCRIQHQLYVKDTPVFSMWEFCFLIGDKKYQNKCSKSVFNSDLYRLATLFLMLSL